MKSLTSFSLIISFIVLLGHNSIVFAHSFQNINSWKAGVARVKITPEESMWMAGYASRDHASEGKLTDLWAKA